MESLCRNLNDHMDVYLYRHLPGTPFFRRVVTKATDKVRSPGEGERYLVLEGLFVSRSNILGLSGSHVTSVSIVDEQTGDRLNGAGSGRLLLESVEPSQLNGLISQWQRLTGSPKIRGS